MNIQQQHQQQQQQLQPQQTLLTNPSPDPAQSSVPQNILSSSSITQGNCLNAQPLAVYNNSQMTQMAVKQQQFQQFANQNSDAHNQQFHSPNTNNLKYYISPGNFKTLRS